MVFQSIAAPDSAFVWNTHQYPRHRLADPTPVSELRNCSRTTRSDFLTLRVLEDDRL